MCRHSDSFPRDIYDAIKKHDQRAIQYYSDAGQVNGQAEEERYRIYSGDLYSLSDYRDDGSYHYAVNSTCLCQPTCITTECCFCSFPLCCGYGIKRRTPLCFALEKKNIEAVRILLDHGALLNTGKYVIQGFCQTCDRHVQFNRISTQSASALLAHLARSNTAARDLLRYVVASKVPLMWGYQKADDELCRELLALNDAPLLQQIVQNRLVLPAYLACVIVENGKKLRDFDFIFAQPQAGVVAIRDRLLKAIARSADPRLVDMLLSEQPDFLTDLCKTAVMSKSPELVAYILSKKPPVAFVRQVMPRVRLRTIAELLAQYILPAPIIPQVSPPAEPDSVSLPHASVSLPSAAEQVRDVDKCDNCPICFKPLASRTYVRRLPCGHNLHGECVSAWLSKHHTCPVCRQPAD